MKKKKFILAQKELSNSVLTSLASQLEPKIFLESLIDALRNAESFNQELLSSIKDKSSFNIEWNKTLEHLVTVLDSYSDNLVLVKVKLYKELESAIIENYSLNRKVYALPSTLSKGRVQTGFTETSALHDFETLKLNLDKSKPVEIIDNIKSSLLFYRKENLKLRKIISKLDKHKKG